MRKHNPQDTGFTLIELLLYVSIVGSLLIAVSMFFALTAESRIKNQSISEVDEQGIHVLNILTTSIRNATSITTPGVGATSNQLTLAMPVAGQNPTIFDTPTTVLGYNQDGGTTDTSNSNFINATKFTATDNGTVSTLFAYIGATVGSSPNNQAQMAIYSGATPTTLLASSTSTALTPNSWNAFTIPTVNITSGQTYWIAYNTNGTTTTQNGMRYHTGTSGQTRFVAQTFGSWPSSWTGSTQNFEFSVYAAIATGSSSALRIKEGAGGTIPLTNSKVEITNLSFKNLSGSGTPGTVQVSVTISRVNPNNRDEYSYQKTFTTSVSIRDE